MKIPKYKDFAPTGSANERGSKQKKYANPIKYKSDFSQIIAIVW